MAEEGAKKKNKKINKFTPEELDVKIKEIKEKMGGVHSKYAEQLLARKEDITKK